MKFMLNGAVTLGTRDGANVEIGELVGEDNIYFFGESSEQVIEHYKNGDYDPLDFYIKDKNIKEVVDFIVSDEIMNIGCEENLIRLYKEKSAAGKNPSGAESAKAVLCGEDNK